MRKTRISEAFAGLSGSPALSAAFAGFAADPVADVFEIIHAPILPRAGVPVACNVGADLHKRERA